jgi:ligand-binding sensor domain-containing protein
MEKIGKKHKISHKKALVTSLFIDNYDQIWVGTDKGVVSFDGEDWKKT